MSNKYRRSEDVPTRALVERLHELAHAVTKGPDYVRREFTMRVPAELDHDADLVLSETACRLDKAISLLRDALPYVEDTAVDCGLAADIRQALGDDHE